MLYSASISGVGGVKFSFYNLVRCFYAVAEQTYLFEIWQECFKVPTLVS